LELHSVAGTAGCYRPAVQLLIFNERVVYRLNGGDENRELYSLLTAYAYSSFWRACIRAALLLAEKPAGIYAQGKYILIRIVPACSVTALATKASTAGAAASALQCHGASGSSPQFNSQVWFKNISCCSRFDGIGVTAKRICLYRALAGSGSNPAHGMGLPLSDSMFPNTEYSLFEYSTAVAWSRIRMKVLSFTRA